MINWGKVPLTSVLPFIFDSFDGGTGASITLTGLALADILVYKGTSMTQRASTAGFVLLDTDGIDIDLITGIHGFSIDTHARILMPIRPMIITAPAAVGGDPEGSLIGGKLIRGGLLRHGVLIGG